MAEMLIDGAKLDACNTAEADAIRAKTGGSSPIPYDYANNKGFADAIAAIPSGTTITDGIVVKARNASGYATEIDYYKDDGIIYSYQFPGENTSPWRDLTTINIAPNTIALNGSGIFRYSKISQATATALYEKVTEIIGDGNAMFMGVASVTEAVLPNCTHILSNQLFRGCTNLQILRLPVCATVKSGTNADGVVPQLSNLTELTVGSVGHPYMYTSNGHFLYQTNNTNLIATFFIGSGQNADAVLSRERAGSTTATIVIKAANALEYNGTSYAAGDTILTSEVTA